MFANLTGWPAFSFRPATALGAAAAWRRGRDRLAAVVDGDRARTAMLVAVLVISAAAVTVAMSRAVAGFSAQGSAVLVLP